ncbi:hypothetical protein KKA95_02845 [Patescibacteria group bacterium]|nr:hypothetical protein [Patescibacteria group bacterium]
MPTPSSEYKAYVAPLSEDLKQKPKTEILIDEGRPAVRGTLENDIAGLPFFASLDDDEPSEGTLDPLGVERADTGADAFMGDPEVRATVLLQSLRHYKPSHVMTSPHGRCIELDEGESDTNWDSKIHTLLMSLDSGSELEFFDADSGKWHLVDVKSGQVTPILNTDEAWEAYFDYALSQSPLN